MSVRAESRTGLRLRSLSHPEIGLHKNVNLWKLEIMKTKRA